MLNVDEFIKNLGNKNNAGLSETSVCVECTVLDLKTENDKPIVSVAFKKPIIRVERHYEFIQLEFSFISALDTDLKLMWNAIELYGKTADDINSKVEETMSFASCGITMMPACYNGEYYCTAVNPLFWSLTSTEVGEAANTIRILFDAEDLKIFKNLNMDLEAEEKKIKEEIAYQARMNAMHQESIEKMGQNKI